MEQEITYQPLSFFNYGFAAVKFKSGEYGYVNEKGNILAKGFKQVHGFRSFENSNPRAFILIDDNIPGYIDQQGNVYKEDGMTLIHKDDPILSNIIVNEIIIERNKTISISELEDFFFELGEDYILWDEKEKGNYPTERILENMRTFISLKKWGLKNE